MYHHGVLAIALLLLLGDAQAQMNCPSGFLTQIWGTVNAQYIRCCTELAPGNLTCAKPWVGNTATDYVVTCADMFAAMAAGSGLCNCGAYCTGTVILPGNCTGSCLCTTYYCCAAPNMPCNVSSPSFNWRVPPSPLGLPPPSPPTAPPRPTAAPTNLVYQRLSPTSDAGRSVSSLFAVLAAVFLFYACLV